MKNYDISNGDWADVYNRNPIEDIKSVVNKIKCQKSISINRLNHEIFNAYMRSDIVPMKRLQRIVDYVKSWF